MRSSDQVVIDLIVTTLTRATLCNMFLRHTYNTYNTYMIYIMYT